MEDNKLTFKDVCNIMMPMLGYYDIYKEKGINLVRSDLGLGILNYKFGLKFQDNYIKAKDSFIEYYLEQALNNYLDDNKLKTVLNEETNEYSLEFNHSKKKCSKEINDYKEVYGDEPVREIRKHVRSLVKKKELPVSENAKYLANYL